MLKLFIFFVVCLEAIWALPPGCMMQTCVTQSLTDFKTVSTRVKEICDGTKEKPISDCHQCCLAVKEEKQFNGPLINDMLVSGKHCNCCFANKNC
ncbi:unnamed protein product, partial [Mesorhabditis belari]|uniref:Uncharacterized protein n=1 Tax=Mesorhabditis belari TaxID=2138241 RepID=A0AAF3F3L2_9BILA